MLQRSMLRRETPANSKCRKTSRPTAKTLDAEIWTSYWGGGGRNEQTAERNSCWDEGMPPRQTSGRCDSPVTETLTCLSDVTCASMTRTTAMCPFFYSQVFITPKCVNGPLQAVKCQKLTSVGDKNKVRLKKDLKSWLYDTFMRPTNHKGQSYFSLILTIWSQQNCKNSWCLRGQSFKWSIGDQFYYNVNGPISFKINFFELSRVELLMLISHYK